MSHFRNRSGTRSPACCAVQNWRASWTQTCGTSCSTCCSPPWFDPAERVTDCRDAKDDKYLELALVAKAGVIVSSDDDLLTLNPWRGVWILRPTEYLRGD
jgi:hypothetical protein